MYAVLRSIRTALDALTIGLACLFVTNVADDMAARLYFDRRIRRITIARGASETNTIVFAA